MHTKTKRPRRAAAAQQPEIRIFVRRGALRRFDRLKQAAENLPVSIEWDRRLTERRRAADPAGEERRKADRRQRLPFTWETADFVLIEHAAAAARKPAKRR